MTTIRINQALGIIASAVAFCAPRAVGSVMTYESFSAWQVAGGAHTTIDFTENYPGIITTQYQSMGVTFTDGNDRIVTGSSFLQDGYALNGWLDDTITIVFNEPQAWIGVHYPGTLRFQLFSQGTLFFQTGIFSAPPPLGLNGFAGLISDQRFDKVVIHDPLLVPFIDNLYFGRPIPAPPVTTLLAVVALAHHRRRRL